MADSLINNASKANVNFTQVPSLRKGFTSCKHCGFVGVKDTFYGKSKQHCSLNCWRAYVTSIKLSNLSPKASKSNVAQNIYSNVSVTSTKENTKSFFLSNKAATFSLSIDKSELCSDSADDLHKTAIRTNEMTSPIKRENYCSDSHEDAQHNPQITPTKSNIGKIIKGNKMQEALKKHTSFCWTDLLSSNPSIKAAQVASFKHVPIASVWDQFVIPGLMVEVRNHCCAPRGGQAEFYWIASVADVAGYFVKLRFEGYGDDSSNDFWINIYSSNIHSVGWCASQGKLLVPPKDIENKQTNWSDFLMNRLEGSKTLPGNFHQLIRDGMKSDFRLGMKLEVIDKTRISAVRVASIDKIIGGRLHVSYDCFEENDTGFWCHQQSPLIHPIGWAQVVGHELRSTAEYAANSLEKAKNKEWEENDADFSYFPHLDHLPQFDELNVKFSKGMKLEAIDPLNLSAICVATVTKVLRNNYLMIGIDGMMAADGSDWFCYHASSGNIFPAGFAKLNDLEITPPRDFQGDFQWFSYLMESKASAAPVAFFKREILNHGFEEGMYLEAVDLMEPRLICVAMITKVVGRLLKIHFNGWDESYDQWCDCESVELFPLGWCEIVGYPLEPPKNDNDTNSNMGSNFVFDNTMKKRGKGGYKGRRKRKRNTLSLSEKGKRLDEEEILNGTSSTVFDEETEDCTIFNSIVESNADEDDEASNTASKNGSECINELASCSLAAEESSSNSSVVVKPSPISLELVLNGNKMRFPSDPLKWSIVDVIKYLTINECGNYAHPFIEAKVTGLKLLQLTREEVLKLTNNKLGPSLKIFALIEDLRKKAFDLAQTDN